MLNAILAVLCTLAEVSFTAGRERCDNELRVDGTALDAADVLMERRQRHVGLDRTTRGHLVERQLGSVPRGPNRTAGHAAAAGKSALRPGTGTKRRVVVAIFMGGTRAIPVDSLGTGIVATVDSAGAASPLRWHGGTPFADPRVRIARPVRDRRRRH